MTNCIFYLQKSNSKLIFADYTCSKNPLRNRLKIHFKIDFCRLIIQSVEIDFYNLIFQKSSTCQQGVWIFHVFFLPHCEFCVLYDDYDKGSHTLRLYQHSAHNVRSLPGTMIYLIRGALCSKLEPLKCNHGNDLWNLLAYIVIITIIIIFPSASFKIWITVKLKHYRTSFSSLSGLVAPAKSSNV